MAWGSLAVWLNFLSKIDQFYLPPRFPIEMRPRKYVVTIQQWVSRFYFLSMAGPLLPVAAGNIIWFYIIQQDDHSVTRCQGQE